MTGEGALRRSERTLLFAGSYADRSSPGIRVFAGDRPERGLAETDAVAGVENPSFLAIHPSGRTIYAVSETTGAGGDPGGGLVAFRVDPLCGTIEEVDRVSSQGDGPCHLAVDPAGAFVHVANYVSGSVAVWALTGDGRFGDLVARHQHQGSGPTDRQAGPHAHCVRPGPDGESVYAVDLGADRIVRYERQGSRDRATFVPAASIRVEPGAGPRHIAFHPGRPEAVLVNELANTISAYSVGADGDLVHLDTRSTLPVGVAPGGLAADVRFHPLGHRVYVSNRGHDSIAVFGTDAPDRALVSHGHTPSGGRTPRCVAVHPSGHMLYVANQDSDRIVPFAVDAESGELTPLDHRYDMPSPTCVTVLEVPA